MGVQNQGMNERLCVFTRYPEPGTTKTRLIPALGPESAAGLQQAMTACLLAVARKIGDDRGSAVQVRYEGGDDARMRAAFGAAFEYRRQGDGNLGDRMRRCFREGFEAGAERVVIVGSDVPGIDSGILSTAFEALCGHDLVIGPATDGGYYLMGLRRAVPELLQGIPWGEDGVLSRTLAIAERQALAVRTLPVLSDVDRPEDLAELEKAWGAERMAAATGSVSVVIPTLNEASRIGGLIATIHAIDAGVDVVVVDGGSTDGTVEIARGGEVHVVTAHPGRAGQMNAGAAAATGGILLFLHADTRLPENFAALVRSTLSKPGVAAGAFAFRLDAAGKAYRVLERAVNWRSRVLQMPYGDQALFMNASIFRELGGFPDIPIMEDFEMVRRLKRRGRISIAPASAVTSARRWQQGGILKTTLFNQLMIAGFYLHLLPQRSR